MILLIFVATLVKDTVSILSRLCDESRNEAVIKPITSPKPITVIVDLSRKSFMTSLFAKQRQELCITIYYNGTLALI